MDVLYAARSLRRKIFIRARCAPMVLGRSVQSGEEDHSSSYWSPIHFVKNNSKHTHYAGHNFVDMKANGRTHKCTIGVAARRLLAAMRVEGSAHVLAFGHFPLE